MTTLSNRAQSIVPYGIQWRAKQLRHSFDQAQRPEKNNRLPGVRHQLCIFACHCRILGPVWRFRPAPQSAAGPHEPLQFLGVNDAGTFRYRWSRDVAKGAETMWAVPRKWDERWVDLGVPAKPAKEDISRPNRLASPPPPTTPPPRLALDEHAPSRAEPTKVSGEVPLFRCPFCLSLSVFSFHCLSVVSLFTCSLLHFAMLAVTCFLFPSSLNVSL